jgi:hypothetical protein
MATSQLINKKIKALEATLKKKSNFKPSVVAKLELQLKSFQAELSKLTSKKSTAKKPSVLQKLKKMVKTKTNLKVYNQAVDKSGRKTDLVRDADRPALPTGRRVSKGTGANQYGKAVKGRVYYENRPNRIDVKQPPKRYPKLEDGGEIGNWYKEGTNIWGLGNTEIYIKKHNNIFELTDAVYDENKSTWIEKTIHNFDSFEEAQKAGYARKLNIYDDGGMMAKGGQVSGYFTFRPYKLEGNFYFSTTLKDVSPDNVMRKGLEGKLKGNDYNSAEYVAMAILDEFDYIDKVEIVKRGATLLKSKVVASFERDSDDKKTYNVQYMADGGMFEEPIAMYRPLSGKTSGKAVVGYDIPKEEFDEFVEYVYDVYNEEGFNKSQVRVAIKKYLRDLEGQYTWGGGDSLDRERVYEYLKNPKQQGIVNPHFKEGGMMAKGGQGYDDREDERLAMEYGKISNKDFVGSHEAREHSRRDDARFEERMADGGMMADDEQVNLDEKVEEYMNKLKNGEKIKRYFHVRGKSNPKYFETIIKNNSEKDAFKRYESTSQNSLGTLQNEYMSEDDVKRYLKKTISEIRADKEKNGTMAKGGSVLERLKKAKEMGIKGYGKAKEYTKKQIHDQKKKVALDVIVDTLNDDYFDTKKGRKDIRAVRITEELVEEHYAKGGMTDVRIKYAKKDIETLQKEGGMSMYDTKYGVIHLSYKNGIFTIRNNQYNPSIEDYKTIFEGNKDEAVKFLADAYVVEMAKGGMTEISDFKTNLMGTASFMLQLPNMRKPQEFIVYPIQESDNPIITIQSDTRIGKIDLSSGRGLMSESHASGAYFVHFQMDKKTPFQLNDMQLSELKLKIKSTGGKEVGSRGIVSDNSGALNIMEMGGKVQFKSHRLNN